MLTDARDVHIGDAHLERTEQAALDRAKRQLSYRNASLVVAVAVAFVLGLAATFFGFQSIHPLFRPESYFIAFSDLFHHHDAQESVMVVAIDSATKSALGPPDGSWRGRHATVVERLAGAGASVVAFNLSFAAAPTRAAATDSLRVAVTRARDRGTSVLAAADTIIDGISKSEPVLLPVVQFGTTCVDTARVTAPVMTLAVGSMRQGAWRRLESLPLAAVAALRGGGSTVVEQLRRSVALEAMIAGDSDVRCGFAAGDTLHRMAVDFAPRHEHLDPANRISYLSVLRGDALPDLKGMLVLVGVDQSQITFPIVRGLHQEARNTIEVAADAMNTVLRGIHIAPLASGAEFVVILVMAALGAAVAYQSTRLGNVGQPLALVAVVVLYFVVGAMLYARDHALLNTLFDLSALVLAFIAVKFTRRIWFP